ncbi:hypothetical protein RclHR1_12840002 [Rhizophagus clarus]|uniref:Kinase-like domain-containing protein n=1 Tax=Rhizophagus clarus TaxID=94130 RepID=A0A2Z6QN89_9GLOM|nr:hypothetical protein RclHR1_12840002 [Rhizophagus clarus]GES94010.1 kinase-like domain-containing protein [Rhizophagus clarus]
MNENTQSLSSVSSVSSLIYEFSRLDISGERLERYSTEANTLISSTKENELRTKAKFLRNEAISIILNDIKLSMKVDLCFVLDCTGSMWPHIAAARGCILQVANYIKNTNPSIEFRVGFCGYRDHNDGSNRLQIFDFNDQYDQFTKYMHNILPFSSPEDDDAPEDVLGGLNAAITQMDWKNSTRVLLHICDSPPHGRHFSNLKDKYPDGDPYGLTEKIVLEKMKSKNILYFFGKITRHTEKMLEAFRGIIGEFPVFDLASEDPIKLIEKFVKATSSSIAYAVSLTSVIGSNSKEIYSSRRRKLDMNPNEPDWNTLPIQKGVVLWYSTPKSLNELVDPTYFGKSNLFYESFLFKIAHEPFSAGAEKYAYFAREIKNEPTKEIVIKEYLNLGERNNPIEKYLEMVEVSTVTSFLSTEFNFYAEQKNISKISFLDVKLLRCNTIDVRARCFAIEPKLRIAEYKRFNTNTGVITEFRSTLEAFVHFTYNYTEGYLVVCDLQGIELNNEFLLTDPAIHCIDPLRFGKTNFGEKGIKQLFLENHRCNEICKKLNLSDIHMNYY